MKNLILSISLLVTSFAFGSNGEVRINSKVKEVTVFLRGAEITNTSSTSLKPGQTEIVLSGLSPDINQNSIQVKGNGEMIILGVSYRLNHLSLMPKTKEMTLLEDSIEDIQFKLSVIEAKKSVLLNEEQLLLANKSIGGQETGVTSEELEKVAAIYRTRLMEIRMSTLNLQKEEKKLGESINRVQNQLNEINGSRNRNTGEIVILVNSKNGGPAKFTTSYLVFNAGWSPLYDLRSGNTNEPIELVYRANVYQTTGEDWNNVKLTLSTGNPIQNSTKPTLVPWWLTFQEYYQQINRNYPSSAPRQAERAESLKDSYSRKVDMPAAESIAEYTTVKENQTRFEYSISIPYSIGSGGKPQIVEIQKYELPAEYKYYTAPKIDPDAFLIARISGWDKYNLLSGEANVYFDGTYVGKSFINTNSTSDTLDLSLGRDKSVVVSRTLIRDLSEKKDIGNGRKVNMVYEIAVRNKKSSHIDIIIEDQVPLTKQGEINIQVDEVGNGSLNEETGLITWKKSLKPGETHKMRFGFTVKYPKGKHIQGL